jgi:hypothetical protein
VPIAKNPQGLEMSEYLNTPDLHTLTGYVRAKKQACWLRTNGIPYRADGQRVIVSTTHARNWLEGRTVVVSSGMNWAAIK